MVEDKKNLEGEIDSLQEAINHLMVSAEPLHEPPAVLDCHKNKCFRTGLYCSMTNFATCRYQSKELYVIGDTGMHTCLNV